jgi:transcriptional regulator with XRE-family HTH domain
MDPDVDVAAALDDLIERSGMSKAELARRAKVSKATLLNYLNGKGRLHNDQWWRITEALGVTAEVQAGIVKALRGSGVKVAVLAGKSVVAAVLVGSVRLVAG